MVNLVAALGNKTTRIVGRSILKLQKVSPDIMIGVGVVGVVATVVYACKKTKSASEECEFIDVEEEINEIHQEYESNDEYSTPEYRKDLAKVYLGCGWKVTKYYAPVIALGTASLALIVGSHHILKKRNVALAAAYKALDESYKRYRKRVIEEFSEEVDKRFRNGIRNEEIEVSDNGEEPKKVRADITDPTQISEYARFFDESCPNWSKDPSYNLHYLLKVQNWANEVYHSRGHLFLNEVYDELGIPRCPAGAVAGWIMGEGDDFIDFGIFDLYKQVNRDFVNGYERSILLDFNVDGVIWDKI